MDRQKQAAINKEYFDRLDSSKVMEDLETHFGLRSVVKKAKAVKPDGSMFETEVDVNATMIAAGAAEVISWIKQRISLGKQGK